jgi:hypothetical protein
MIDPALLWTTEWIVCSFFTYLMVLGIRRPLPRRHRLRVLAISAACAWLAVMLSQLRLSPALQVLREWIPAVYLLQGYWLCGLFFERPMPGAERRLLAIDRWVFRQFRVTDLVARAPRAVLEYFELAYLFAYPFVPISFALFLFFGGRPAVDSFWATTLIAGYGAYGVLPWIQTRPPRTLEGTNSLDRRLFFRKLNASVLHHASVQVNTFPSGHASVVVATAFAVATVSGAAGLAAGVVAGSITLATVLGRYHYTADSVIGVMLGVIAWWLGFHVL